MKFEHFTDLAAELRAGTLEHAMATASLKRVMAMSTVCREWRDEVGRILPGWLSKHAAGRRIGEFEGTKEQVEFVRDHMQGK
jgi:hypothetical protein